MRHVPIAAFKDRISEFVDAIEAGDEVIITRHGRPAARVCPVFDDEAIRAKRREAVVRLSAFRAQQLESGVSVAQSEWINWKNEGRP